MSQEGINNKKESIKPKTVSYGKDTMSKITKFLSGIIKETSSNKESKGNFLKSERKDK